MKIKTTPACPCTYTTHRNSLADFPGGAGGAHPPNFIRAPPTCFAPPQHLLAPPNIFAPYPGNYSMLNSGVTDFNKFSVTQLPIKQ